MHRRHHRWPGGQPGGALTGHGESQDPRRQSQFLEVVDRDEAERRFHSALKLSPLGREAVPLATAVGRVLAGDVRAAIDVPGFTRSDRDGFAVRAADTFGCDEVTPGRLSLNQEILATGIEPRLEVAPGTATPIATGAVVPRGADAVLMVEHTGPDGDAAISVTRAVAPGAHLTQAGADIARGETVLHGGILLTPRETVVLAALGLAQVEVYRRPRVAILSTGAEIVPPGRPLAVGQVYDANATLLADAVRQAGGEPHLHGIIVDDADLLEAAVRQALAAADMVLLSGGTSKGAGDVGSSVLARLPAPGILVHGVALKPGKPVCLAVCGSQPVVILPGFPTSAMFTFHEFVAPVLHAWGRRPQAARGCRRAILPRRLNSDRGRTEYVLVGLVQPASPGSLPVAVPMGKGSGSVTAYGAADGFITIPRQTEYLEAGGSVEVTLLSEDLRPADLVIQGSHCLGLDLLLGELRGRGVSARMLAVGSEAGLAAVAAGHADVAGIHLLDAATGTYNRPFLPQDVTLLHGYGRMQGIVFRAGDPRFAGKSARAAVGEALAAGTGCVLISRNRGSGTRALLDDLLRAAAVTSPGPAAEARSHHAVAAAVAQGRADWGIAISNVAHLNGLGFLPLQEERFDFAVAPGRGHLPAVLAFAATLADAAVRRRLEQEGFLP